MDGTVENDGNDMGSPLQPALYLVSTPIGSARDITLRGLDIIRDADVLAAEDTRTARRLLSIHEIPLRSRQLISYHDRNGTEQIPKLIKILLDGGSVAYLPDAGTPLIADPGFKLVAAAVSAAVRVTSVPGPSAMLAALASSGLATDRFLFAGFPPNRSSARRRAFEELSSVPATLIFYESPRRLKNSLGDMASAFGPERQAAICRELTKKYEETRRGTLEFLCRWLESAEIRGEYVIIVSRGTNDREISAEIQLELKGLMERMSLRDAVAEISERFRLPRKEVYGLGIRIREND